MLKQRLRRWRRAVDSAEMAQVRRLVGAFECGPGPAVVHFGSSESLFRSEADTDRRLLTDMIRDALEPGTDVASYLGAGYHPGLYDAVLRHLAPFPHRPVLLVSLATRFGQAPWALHPHYGYAPAIARLQRMSPGKPGWVYRLPVPVATARAMTRFDTIRYSTLEGELAIGEYRRSLTEPDRHGLSAERATARLFAYHHGAIRPPSAHWLDRVQRLGATARTYGYPVVAYELPIPVERGVEMWGDHLRDLNQRWSDQVRTAFEAGYGQVVTVRTALILGSEAFIDVDDATEHVNQSGRRALADLIVPAVERALQVHASSAASAVRS